MNKKQKGYTGEKIIASYLVENDYNILVTNFRATAGEIDIIACKNNKLIFFEVKTWDYYSEESLENSINNKKKYKIINTAKYFLLNNPKFNGYLIQFDIILYKKALNKILHYKEAFGN